MTRRFAFSWRMMAAVAASAALAGFQGCTMPDYRMADASAGAAGSSVLPHCSNTLWEHDLGESDFDCGGGCTPCDLGKTCDRSADCASDNCEASICVAKSLMGAGGMTAGASGSGGAGSSAGGSVGVAGSSVGGCDANSDCNTGGEPACPRPLGTTSDCVRCGEACGEIAPFCRPEGCTDHLDMVVGGPSAHAMKTWDGKGATALLSVSHELKYARGSSRIVLLGLAASGPFPETLSVVYDDVPMLKLIDHEHISRQSRAAVYYLLDEQLPSKAGVSNVSVTFGGVQAWGHGGFDVVEFANAQQTKPTITGSAEAQNCDAPATRGVMLEFDQPGSLVFGVLAARGAKTLPSLLQAPPVTETWNQRVSIVDDPLSGSTAWVFDDDTRSLNWLVPSCYNTAAVAVAVQRLTAE